MHYEGGRLAQLRQFIETNKRHETAPWQTAWGCNNLGVYLGLLFGGRMHCYGTRVGQCAEALDKEMSGSR